METKFGHKSGHSSVQISKNMTDNNPNIGIVNMHAYLKFVEIMSNCSQDMEGEGNADVNQWP